MMLIRDYIYNVESNVTQKGFCEGVTNHVRERYDKSHLTYFEAHPEERLTASCIVYSRCHNEIWMIGDCQCIAGGVFHENPKSCELTLARERAKILQTMLDSGTAIDELRGNDPGRKAIIPKLIETMHGQNIAYSVVDGFPIPPDKVKVISLAARPQTVVLATDGYPFLKSTLAESEAALREQLLSDPLNIHTFLATKACQKGANSFDDRTYIRFKT